ncbi:hypothetical protein ACHQM5_028570 [Ranunculus cassubicifolius]
MTTQSPRAFWASEDIMKIVRQHVNWETVDDLDKARYFYTTMKYWENKMDFDFDKELDKLKALHSAVEKEHDISIKQLQQLEFDMGENFDEDDIRYQELTYRIASIYGILSPVKQFIHHVESAKPPPPRALRASEDILKLVHQHVHWKTLEDLNVARQLYTKTWRQKKDFDIEKELDKLKDLHSALGKVYDITLKKLQEPEMENADDDDIEFRVVNDRMECICEIFFPLKDFIYYLESAKPVSKAVECKDYSGNLERGRLEEGLLNVLTQLCGETYIDKISTGEFSSRWDGIVNDLHALVG